MRLTAVGPQHRLHYSSKLGVEAASGFNPFRGPGCGLHRAATLCAAASPGQAATPTGSGYTLISPLFGMTRSLSGKTVAKPAADNPKCGPITPFATALMSSVG